MIRTIGIVGFGQMGSGIAQVTAAAGYPVLAMDMSDQVFKHGIGYITKSLDKAIEKGKADAKQKDTVLGSIKQASSLKEFVDRDIVIEVCAVDLNQNVITVGDIMAPELVTVREDEGLLQTVEIMRFKGVRRLPVVDKNGNLSGIVSIDDLFEALTEQMAEMGRILGREREHEIQNRR